MKRENMISGVRTGLGDSIQYLLTDDANEYLDILAEILMIEELLCGEADPVEFLRESLKQADLEHSIRIKERALCRLITKRDNRD